MSKETQAIKKDLGQLADDASALLVANADVAGEKLAKARKRLVAIIVDSGSSIFGSVNPPTTSKAPPTHQPKTKPKTATK